jgi:hypothetical protein
VIGNSRTRTPVACQTAFATAPAVPVMPIFTDALYSKSIHVRVVFSIRIASRAGTSAFTGIWYSARLGFMGRPERRSMMACSCSANDTTQIMPPLSWLRTKRQMMIRSFYGCGLLWPKCSANQFMRIPAFSMMLALRRASSFRNVANSSDVVPSGSAHNFMNCRRTRSSFITVAMSR